ncbi:hypothetical protein H8356DRAFT_1434670 [Neocallimastix lanati (nom. inval.)]|nr:hypothetical protein H8356DRAFT_1434670 [Neocallimastix sp. JGI-2020a]
METFLLKDSIIPSQFFPSSSQSHSRFIHRYIKLLLAKILLVLTPIGILKLDENLNRLRVRNLWFIVIILEKIQSKDSNQKDNNQDNLEEISVFLLLIFTFFHLCLILSVPIACISSIKKSYEEEKLKKAKEERIKKAKELEEANNETK